MTREIARLVPEGYKLRSAKLSFVVARTATAARAALHRASRPLVTARTHAARRRAIVLNARSSTHAPRARASSRRRTRTLARASTPPRVARISSFRDASARDGRVVDPGAPPFFSTSANQRRARDALAASGSFTSAHSVSGCPVPGHCRGPTLVVVFCWFHATKSETLPPRPLGTRAASSPRERRRALGVALVGAH